MINVATAFSGGFGPIEFALKYEEIPHEVIFAVEGEDYHSLARTIASVPQALERHAALAEYVATAMEKRA